MASGMPWAGTIRLRFASRIWPNGASRAIYAYCNGLSGAYRTATTSLIDCSKLEVLADATRTIFAAHSEEAAPDLTQVQHFDRQRPYICFDLRDYLLQIATADEMSLLDQALAATVIYRAATPSILGTVPVNTHCGLSTYAMGSGDATLDSYYTTLDWYQQVYPISNPEINKNH